MPRDWRARTAEGSNVEKLVHLAFRQDEVDRDDYRARLLRIRRDAYEDEITIQAGRVGCPGQHGRLTTGPSLAALNADSFRDADSIVASYNYDLAAQIEAIRAATPTANRHTYAARLTEWSAQRAQWKDVQIAQYAEGTARGRAQSDFAAYNDTTGYAVLEPTDAVCPICLGWIARDKVPISVAVSEPPPYHPNCPHRFVQYPHRIALDECYNLWVGE